MSQAFTDAELDSYLDETLNGTRAAELEQQLREDASLLKRLTIINGRRGAGVHTLGEIWRRNQIAVPTRDEMGSYLLGVLPDDHAQYIRFRIEVLGCPFTIAMKTDLENQHQESADSSSKRRKKFFDSSAGLLRKRDD